MIARKEGAFPAPRDMSGEHTAPNGQVFTVKFRDLAQAAQLNKRYLRSVRFGTGWYYRYYKQGTHTTYNRGQFASSLAAYEHAMERLKGPRPVAVARNPLDVLYDDICVEQDVTHGTPHAPPAVEYTLQGFAWPDGTLGKLSAAVNELLADASRGLGCKPQAVDVVGAVFENNSVRLRLVPRPASEHDN